jgi:hypothetical protein
VPLNWSQIEDDDALATLQFLQPAADEALARTSRDVPAGLRKAIYDDLEALLPEPKPVPVKEAPKSLAGFSERVQVLTQVEDDIPPLVTNMPQWIGACALAAVGIAFVFYFFAGLTPTGQGPTFRWIELRQNDVQISQVGDRSYWTQSQCQGFALDDPEARREFVSLPDAEQLQAVAGFPIYYPQPRVSAPGTELTYTLKLIGSGISSCTELVPDPSDLGQQVRHEYFAYSYTTTGRNTETSRFKIFQANRIPLHIDVSSGEWEEVQVGELKGVYWHGDRYRDAEGRMWGDGAHVLMAEEKERVFTIIASAEEGISKELLLTLATGMRSQRPTDLSSPTYHVTSDFGFRILDFGLGGSVNVQNPKSAWAQTNPESTGLR